MVYSKEIINELDNYCHTFGKDFAIIFDDWLEWFKDCDRTKPLAIINFTKKRY